MEENIKEDKNKSLNPVSEILLILLCFAGLICLTYFLCVCVIGGLIAAVVFAIIYGVCHTVLEFVRILKRSKKEKTAQIQSCVVS